MVPIIETDRLFMRAPGAADFPVYERFYSDKDASRNYGGPLDPGQAWRVLATDIGHWTLRGYGRWALALKKTGKMIGSCGLWWPHEYPRTELTWWIMPNGRRQGFAKEASLAAIKFGYDTLGWDLVETHMNDDNLAARNLAVSLGGTVITREKFPDGLYRDIFALPRPD